MKKYLLFVFVIVILFSEDCNACFKHNIMNEKIIPTYNTFYEECCCTEPGYTIKDLMWLGPDNRIIGSGIGSAIYIEDQGDCLALHIPNTSKTMSGVYSCVTTYAGEKHVEKHNLDVYDPVYFFNTSAVQYLVEGQNSMIRCDARGWSTPLFKWSRGNNGQDEIKNSWKYQTVPGGLIVKNVNNDDNGIYKCSASVMTTGEELEIDIEVQVMTVPKIKRLTASPENITTTGESVTIECLAVGLPDPNYSWRKLDNVRTVDKKANEKPNNVSWDESYNKITFDSIKPEDAGRYECSAHNFVGETREVIEIKVQVPPSIVYFSNRTAVEGEDIIVLCNATGAPTPNITITYEGKSFEDEKDTIYEEIINNYSILKVDRSKEGFYICNATNEEGFETALMYLTVLRKPHFDEEYKVIWGWNGETVNLICEPDAYPPANISWRYYKTDDEEAIIDEQAVNHRLAYEVSNAQNYTITFTNQFDPYGLFKCIAKNDLGEDVQRIALKHGHVPFAPNNETLTEITATSATFKIGAYSYIGPQIIGVIGEYDIAENYKITYIHRNRTWSIDRPLKIDNLKPNTTYNIRFAAINRVGTGIWGEKLEFQTLEKSAPEPPMWQVDPLQFSPSNVLKWQEPEDNGEPIEYYALRYCPIYETIDESECKENVIKQDTSHHLSDLKYNTTYFIELVAHNAEGNSTPAIITVNTSTGPEPTLNSEPLLSGEGIIGISFVVVLLCLVLVDLFFLWWRRQGIIATCCLKKSKKQASLTNSRDMKGLLKDRGTNIEHHFQKYKKEGSCELKNNRSTGVITGKHSSV